MRYIIDDILTFFRHNYLVIISIIISLSCLIFLIITFIPKEENVNDEVITTDSLDKSSEVTKEDTTKKETIRVDVKGEVTNPGVYEMNENQTVLDAINMAGGLTKKGITTDINLSKKITNEMVIVVSAISEKKSTKPIINNNATINSSSSSTSKETKSKVSINTGTQQELMTLTGIGESKAKNIIAYREKNGLFKKIDDIKNVSGIGEAVFAKIKGNIII